MKLATRSVAKLYCRWDVSLVWVPTSHAPSSTLILLDIVYPHLIRPVELCLNYKMKYS